MSSYRNKCCLLCRFPFSASRHGKQVQCESVTGICFGGWYGNLLHVPHVPSMGVLVL